MYLGYQETNPFCTDPLSEPHLFPKVFLNQESMEFFFVFVPARRYTNALRGTEDSKNHS